MDALLTYTLSKGSTCGMWIVSESKSGETVTQRHALKSMKLAGKQAGWDSSPESPDSPLLYCFLSFETWEGLINKKADYKLLGKERNAETLTGRCSGEQGSQTTW